LTFDLGACRKRARGSRSRLERFGDRGKGLLAETGTDVSDVLQNSPGIMHAQEQGAESGSLALGLGVASDEELLARAAIQLD